MNITIEPMSAKTLKRGDFFRDGGQTFRIANIEQSDEVIEIVYYTGTSSFVNSFFLSPDDTLDKVVDTSDKRALVLNINRAVNTIIRIAADTARSITTATVTARPSPRS